MPNMLQVFVPSSTVNAIRDGHYIEDTYLDSRYKTERAAQDLYTMYREYYDGEHDTELTERAAEFLELSPLQEFSVNACPIVVDAKAERLVVTGFTAETQAETLWEWWQANNMDGQQGIIHTAAIRDGDAYVLVEWDNADQRPRFTFEMAYAGGEGVKVHYSKEHRGKIDYASKRWIVEGGGSIGKTRRLNLYFDNHIEKYASVDGEFEGNWRPYLSDDEDGGEVRDGLLGECGWYWWTVGMAQGGEPLGVPVVHFKNLDQGYARGKSELKDVIPLQNALNKAAIDMVVEADVAAFRLITLTGQAADGLSIYPGAILNSTDPESQWGALPPADMSQMIAVKDSFFMDIARVTRTPISYFQVTGQRPAADTLQQEESGLVAKVTKAQIDFGNAWETMMEIARRLHNAFSGNATPNLDEAERIEAVWKDPNTRNEKEHLETLALKKALGVMEEMLWAEMGYDADQIAKLTRARMRIEAEAIRRMSQQGQTAAPANMPMAAEVGNDVTAG